MAAMLKDALQNIQTHRTLSPHYSELLDILEEILILREEHRRRVKRDLFPVEAKLIPAKMAGGLPLVDFSSAIGDLTEPMEYFLALLEIAEKRAPGETDEMARKIRDGEIRFSDLIYESFNPPPEEEVVVEAAEADEEESSFDLVELFIAGDRVGVMQVAPGLLQSVAEVHQRLHVQAVLGCVPGHQEVVDQVLAGDLA